MADFIGLISRQVRNWSAGLLWCFFLHSNFGKHELLDTAETLSAKKKFFTAWVNEEVLVEPFLNIGQISLQDDGAFVIFCIFSNRKSGHPIGYKIHLYVDAKPRVMVIKDFLSWHVLIPPFNYIR